MLKREMALKLSQTGFKDANLVVRGCAGQRRFVQEDADG